jgi:peptidoglycan DL-endopeptidase CwlO
MPTDAASEGSTGDAEVSAARGRPIRTTRAGPPPGRRRGSLTASLAVLLFTTGTSLVVPGTITPASADIDRDIADARATLSTMADQTEAATEAFNAGRIRLAAVTRAAADAQSRVTRAGAALAALAARHDDLAAAAYGQNGLEQLAVLMSGDPETALDRAGAIDALARRQEARRRTLALARHDLLEAQAAADAALAAQQRQIGRLQAQKRAIEAAVDRQQALLAHLVARQAELVREARAREAAARAAAARAAAAASAREAAAAEAALARQAALEGQAGAGFAASPITAAPGGATLTVASGRGGVAAALAAGYAELGKPYVWGAAGPDSFDCSGLTQWVWARAGVALAHYTGDQWSEGSHVDRADLRPGDLVFFGSDLHHVGMYVGGGKMLDAPHTGAVVRVEPVWWSQYAGAVRVTG